MSIIVEEKNRKIRELINGTYESIQTIINTENTIAKPSYIREIIELQYGILIGITGDIKGQLFLEGERSLFKKFGVLMFGIPLEGEMLNSFSGELGNMIAGQLCTIVSNKEISIDITSPTIVYGDVAFSEYQQIIQLTAEFAGLGKMDVYMLLQ